ncbi:MAG: ABC transporter substrate-binding protein [Geminicoccaceae bacterium]
MTVQRLLGRHLAILLAGAVLGLGHGARAADPIVIGAAIAQSGVVAPYDEGPAQGMELAVEEINAKGGLLGRPLKIVYADTKSEIAQGSTAAQEVIDQGASLVVVTCDYDFGSAAASVANDAGLITFSTCAGDPKFGPSGIGPNAFTMATSSPGQAVALAEWAYNVKGWRTAYILLETTIAFDASFADAFKRRWIELAGEKGFLGQDTYGGEDPQISTQINRIKALPQQPDVIALASFPPAGPSALRQLRAAGIDQPVVASESWDGDYWLEATPGLGNFYFVTYASVFGTDPRPAMQDYMAKFEKKFGHHPITSHTVTGYGVIEAWTKAVTRAGELDAEKVRAELEKFAGEPLLVGPTTFTAETHINNQRDLALMEIENGKQGTVVGIISAQKMPE